MIVEKLQEVNYSRIFRRMHVLLVVGGDLGKEKGWLGDTDI